MRRRKSLFTMVLVAVIAATCAGTGPSGASARPVADGPVAAPAVTADNSRQVTLITGDRFVIVGQDVGDEQVVLREPVREGISFHRFRVEGRLHIVPSDALPALSARRLDLRLFDIAALTSGAGEHRGHTLGLIVTGDGPQNKAFDVARLRGLRVGKVLSTVNGVAVRADTSELDHLWPELREQLQGGELTVWLDDVVPLALDTSRSLVRASEAWEAGFNGSGVAVAVLDTGIETSHPDLADKVVERQDFTGEGPADTIGHGTHVASTIAGTGVASAGAYRGVAPGVSLLDGKVCGSDGCRTSAIIAGMEWAAAQGASVVNMSLGALNRPGLDPMEQALESLTAEKDILFVTAAGNDGATVSSPASAPSALAVGAIADDLTVASFSNRGEIDGQVKPEIVAPGVSITAARSGASDGDGHYSTLSGTSMAAPHVAAAAAILAQRHPDWSAGQLKAGLIGAATPLTDAAFTEQGGGTLDVTRAVTSDVTASPGAVAFGRAWDLPDEPVTRTVTYRNSGASPITLQLRFAPTAADGSAAPEGMFELTAASVTVPAGGSSTVGVIVDPRVDVARGHVGGQLIAEAGSRRVSTPIGLLRDEASYDVTFRQIPRSGEGPASFYAYAFGLDRDSFAYAGGAVSEEGMSLRLPAGRHLIVQGVSTPRSSTFMVQPALEVSGPGQIAVADTRKAKRVSATLPDRAARLRVAELATSMPKTFVDPLGGTSVDYSYLLPGTADLGDPFGAEYFGQAGPDLGYAGLTTEFATTWSAPRADGSLADSPEVYYLSWPGAGRAYTGTSYRVRSGELATVTSSFATQADGARGGVAMVRDRGGAAVAPTALEMSFPLPFQRVEHYNDRTVRWQRYFAELGPGLAELSNSVQLLAHYVPPRRYSTSLNRGVFAPSVAQPLDVEGWATRTGDTMAIRPPTLADGAGRPGDSAATIAESTTLYRNGTNIAEAPRSGYLLDCDDALPPASTTPGGPCPTGLTAQVPGGDSDYRIVVSAERGAPHQLSTRVHAEWTFRSGTVLGGAPHRLPLSTVRIAPDLDMNNSAPAGQAFTFPVLVEAQPDSAAGPVRALDLEVSFDDGASWQAVQSVRQKGDGHFSVTMRHPATPGYVSLRAGATDANGNTVKQTIIRAYRIG